MKTEVWVGRYNLVCKPYGKKRMNKLHFKSEEAFEFYSTKLNMENTSIYTLQIVWKIVAQWLKMKINVPNVEHFKMHDEKKEKKRTSGSIN